MNRDFRFKSIAALTLCSYFYWDFFYLEITFRYGANALYVKGSEYEKLPFHRLSMALSFVVFLLNFKVVMSSVLKNKALLVLIIYVLITSIWAYNTIAPIKTFTFLLSIYFISIIVALAYKEDKLNLTRYLFWLFFVLVILSIITALKFPQYGIDFHHFGSGPRWIGVAGHPNKLGSLCLASVWVSITLFYLTNRIFEKTLAVIALLCAFYTIKGADSMTSMFASLAILGYTIYNYWIGTKSIGVRVVFLSVSALAFIVATTLYMSAGDMVDTTLKASGRNATLTGRSIQWAAAFESIKEHPLLGEGFDDLKPLTKRSHIDMGYIHSGYLALLVRGGFVAGILLAIVLVSAFFKQLSFRKTDPQCFIFLNAGLMGILLHNVAESTILIDLSGLNILLFFILVSTNETDVKTVSNRQLGDVNSMPFPNIGVKRLPQGPVTE